MDPTSQTHRHHSRLKREMYANRLNPFNSPPSSTGSHGTVSTTTTVDVTNENNNLSAFSFSPDAEGTRKFSDDLRNRHHRPAAARSGRFGTTKPSTIINTSALGRTFPEWVNLSSTNLSSTLPTQEVDGPRVNKEEKENIPPAHHDADGFDAKQRKRTRAEMQPRVENASDHSSIFSPQQQRPIKPSRRSRFSLAQVDGNAGPDAPPEPAGRSASDKLVSRIRAAQASNERKVSQAGPKQPSPSARGAAPADPMSSPFANNKSGLGATGRSFLLPSLPQNIFDWTSGTLKFSTMRNGVPVFVKHGTARSRFQQRAPEEHDTIDALDIPEEDREIFISMDKLREEVKELQDHDEMVQQEAEKLQLEINYLQAELKKFKTRRGSDSAIGSDSEESMNRALDAQRNQYDEKIANLQDRLEEASRQVGVNDIHSAALTAERDEALHQASTARERSKRLQTELDSVRKDLEMAFKHRHNKESLEQELASLRASSGSLRQEHDILVANNKSLDSQHTKLRLELEAAQQELAIVREELRDLGADHDALRQEKSLIAQDQADLEHSNESYFKENKAMRSKIDSQEQRIRDLERGIANRDRMIDELEQADATRTTGAVGRRDQDREVESDVAKLRQHVQRQEAKIGEASDALDTAKNRITALGEENVRLVRQVEVLRSERQTIEDQIVTDKHKNVRLNQALLKNETRYLQHLNDHNDECERREEQCKQKEVAFSRRESTLSQQLNRRDAAVKKAKQLTREITNLSLADPVSTSKAISSKTSRVGESSRPANGRYATSEQSAKSDSMDIEDDPTTRLDLTQGSDFASIFTDEEIPKLKETIRYLRQAKQRQQQQQHQDTQDTAGNTTQTNGTAPTLDSDLPSLPPLMRRTRSDETVTQKQGKPVGILKKTGYSAQQEDELTGRFSVKSGVSMQSNQTAKSSQSFRPTSRQQAGPRPASRFHRRAQSDTTDRFDLEQLTGRNETSAFFVPDITLHSDQNTTGDRAQPAASSAAPSLSKDARRILDGVCRHKSRNCTVCTRISAHGRRDISSAAAECGSSHKKSVRVQKPIPVTDRTSEQQQGGEYEEEPTMRPAMAPGQALAVVIKEIEDEIEHLEIELLSKNRAYCALDKSVGQRERKRAMAQIQRLHRELEAKSSMLYRLHDVLEGQKVAGQVMTEEELEVTIASICGLENGVGGGTREESRDVSWNGFE